MGVLDRGGDRRRESGSFVVNLEHPTVTDGDFGKATRSSLVSVGVVSHQTAVTKQTALNPGRRCYGNTSASFSNHTPQVRGSTKSRSALENCGSTLLERIYQRPSLRH